MKLKHKLIKETGQAMVEFALVLPILLLFIGGIIDFGWIFHNQLAANNASREAARFIAIHYYFDKMNEKSHYADGSAEKIAYEIIDSSTNLELNINNIEQITPVNDDINGGKKIKVKFTGEVKILTPILSVFIDEDNNGTFSISSECTMRVEQ